MPLTSKYYAERKKPTNINTKQSNHKKDLNKTEQKSQPNKQKSKQEEI